MIDINNLFQYCDESILCSNTLFSVGDNHGNTVLTLSVNSDNNYINKYSNEWLYLINSYYPCNPLYNSLINFYNHIVHNRESAHHINEDVISFITSFSTGTVHGYSGIYHIISEYLNNYEIYKDKKIIVAVNSQKGILDIIDHLCHKGAIDRNKIIYLDKNIIYRINSITFIPNRHHIIDGDLPNKVTDIINKYFVPDRNDIEYYNSLKIPHNLDVICIIKGSNSHNLTGDGVVPQCNIINFANSWGISIIEPGEIHEVELIHSINQSRIFITTWGTAFMKNFSYISDHCQRIVVLVIGHEFIQQYNNTMPNVLTRHKNAEIVYRIVDESLNLNPFE
jgi:hypothetical protein